MAARVAESKTAHGDPSKTPGDHHLHYPFGPHHPFGPHNHVVALQQSNWLQQTREPPFEICPPFDEEYFAGHPYCAAPDKAAVDKATVRKIR